MLLATFWQGHGGFLSRLYFTFVAFVMFTAVRHGWSWLNRKEQAAPVAPRWKNPGMISTTFLVVHFALILPMIKPSREGNSGEIGNKVSIALNAAKQEWFDRFHPVGTAKTVKIHEVTVRNTPQGKRSSARFTLYWEGPVTKDGFTKIAAEYDFESERWVRAEILETNGTTKAQVLEGAAAILSGMVEEVP